MFDVFCLAVAMFVVIILLLFVTVILTLALTIMDGTSFKEAWKVVNGYDG